ncbi:hypothetical protein FRUB_04470 [Fimbriiglobus ruber]|uniref:Uncharacterized protein n=1 Tax=Fimbriiglobus ruber TaxID=1908690 RepID=A0A225DLY8_9BACT|nr:hypothetical protein FRUB_04470 [Fimbriiglobus ruber]
MIVKEIRKALAEGKAGAACDVESWQSVLRRADENLSVRKGEA